jgi:hypothetical protein
MNTETIYCPNCGTANPSDALFCSNCGTNLEGVLDDQHQASYDQALKLRDEQKYADSERLFTSLGGFKDAATQAATSHALADQQAASARDNMYAQAQESFANGELGNAQNLFGRLGNYKDAADKLRLVNGALAQQQKEDAAQKQERDYQQAIIDARQQTTAAGLKRYIDYFAQFGTKAGNAQLLTELNQRYLELSQQEDLHKAASAKKRNIILGIVAVTVLIAGGSWFFVKQQQSAAANLQQKVSQQRVQNDRSFSKLDADSRKDIKTMFATYHANPDDYIYNVKRKTGDYTVITYEFRGPDKTKDILPAKGTRVYDETALYRVE